MVAMLQSIIDQKAPSFDSIGVDAASSESISSADIIVANRSSGDAKFFEHGLPPTTVWMIHPFISLMKLNPLIVLTGVRVIDQDRWLEYRKLEFT
ncbi:unnamed protein product [Peronospora farinosa]|uniref:Uncharacterized protein n=1 Tax=Peronospora farinosa TaxID=134698 RepID=A0ABN8CHT9_9STRA|nr:unnamed protein product [Peronospora farinosa]